VLQGKMSEINFLDGYYLGLTAIASVGLQFFFCVIAVVFKFDKVTDLAYGTNFILLSLMTLFFNETFYIRQIVVTLMVSIYGIRLAGYLFMRITVIGEDKRFDGTRNNPIKFAIWFLFQAIAVWLIHLPETFLNADDKNEPLAVNDYVGWIIWCFGFLLETIADHQKFIFKQNPENKGKWCDAGLWKCSRHPNYFGDICIWWGMWISVASVLSKWEWFTVISPISITLLLMFGSGTPTTEKSNDEKFWNVAEYQQYKARTPVLIPFIPGIFQGTTKSIFCCEWSFYSYPPGEETALKHI